MSSRGGFVWGDSVLGGGMEFCSFGDGNGVLFVGKLCKKVRNVMCVISYSVFWVVLKEVGVLMREWDSF